MANNEKHNKLIDRFRRLTVLNYQSEPTEPEPVIQLPVDKSGFIFPTGKEHVSYSEIIDWMECSFRHKLKHIDKIDIGSGSSIHTEFGQVIHDAAEEYLKTRKSKPSSQCLVEFRDRLKAIDPKEQEKALKHIPEFMKNLPDMVDQIPLWLEENFPGWELFDAEHLLMEEIKGSKIEKMKFKGYLDCIIKVKKNPTKKALLEYRKLNGVDSVLPDEWEYYIIDWKTCSWGWKIDQKRSFEKQMQLMLYKHFFCQKHNIPTKSVKCGFALIKRQAPKTRKPLDRIEYVPVSVGPVANDKALKAVHNMINQVKSGRVTKNRKHCKPFCPYLNTTHCP